MEHEESEEEESQPEETEGAKEEGEGEEEEGESSDEESLPDAGALDDEDDSDFDPNDDPDKLWCFCKKPHGNRYFSFLVFISMLLQKSDTN